jgi:SHAQKYF class myb-like DNA-binding protein
VNTKKEKKIIFQFTPAFNNESSVDNSIKSKKSDIFALNSSLNNDKADKYSQIKSTGKKLRLSKQNKLEKIKPFTYELDHAIDFKNSKKFSQVSGSQYDSCDDDNFNTGRWQADEHIRFIEAILRYGNEWKKVQQHVGSRSSTQARSHAQKFFVKIKRKNLLDFNIDLNKNSIKYLHDVANSMHGEDYLNTIKTLNNIAFEKKSTSGASNNTFHNNKEIYSNSLVSPSSIFTNSNTHTTDHTKKTSFSNLTEANNIIIRNSKEEKVDECIGIKNLQETVKRESPKIKTNLNSKSSNVKIVSLNDNSRDCDYNIKSCYNKPNNIDLSNNIIIYNKYNNYNNHENVDKNSHKNYATNNSTSLFNNHFMMKKRPRTDSNENIFNNNNLFESFNCIYSGPKLKIEEDFFNNFYNSGIDCSSDDNLNHINPFANPFSIDNYLSFNNTFYNNPITNTNPNPNIKDSSDEKKEFNF